MKYTTAKNTPLDNSSAPEETWDEKQARRDLARQEEARRKKRKDFWIKNPPSLLIGAYITVGLIVVFLLGWLCVWIFIIGPMPVDIILGVLLAFGFFSFIAWLVRGI